MLASRSSRACIFLLIIGSVLIPLHVEAALLPSCASVPTQAGEPCSFKHLIQLVVNIYNWSLGFAGLIAMIMIVFGGVQMLIYHYMEQPDPFLQGAKHTVSRAITGLIIVIAAFLIVNTLLLFLGVPGGLDEIIGRLNSS